MAALRHAESDQEDAEIVATLCAAMSFGRSMTKH